MDGSVVRGYLWSGPRLVAETDASGTVLSRFVYGSRAHVPDYLVDGATTYRLVTDERGSVRLVVDTATGAVVQRIDYDPWGRVTADTNPGFQPFGYAGGLTDPDTGLVRFGDRDYDPTATQWLSRDTIGFTGGTNHYAYADGDPVNRIDPTDHSAIGCFADVLGLLGMVPVIGTVFDVASALAYLAAGDWGTAALALSGIILPLSASQLKGIARYGDDALGFADEGADAARGLSRHGGVLSSETNAAGGTVWTSQGAISQNDVAPIVNSGMYSGNVNIITGVHGLPNGSTVVDTSLYAADVKRFGSLPGGVRSQPPGLVARADRHPFARPGHHYRRLLRQRCLSRPIPMTSEELT